MKNSFTLIGRIKSFKYAGEGILTMLKSQQNAWIHALVTIVVCLLGLCFGFSKSEWCWVILAMIAVWTAEALNTAFEFLADVTSPDYNPLVKNAKDVAAGAVLISAVGAAVIGIIIIGPYALKLF